MSEIEVWLHDQAEPRKAGVLLRTLKIGWTQVRIARSRWTLGSGNRTREAIRVRLRVPRSRVVAALLVVAGMFAMSACVSTTGGAPPVVTIGTGRGNLCTVSAAIERGGEVVSVTALHCIDSAKAVVQETGEELSVIEKFPDYDLALLTSPKTAELRVYDTAAWPESGAMVCKYGSRVEVSCGEAFTDSTDLPESVNLADLCSVPGDSGSAIIWEGKLVGVESGDVANTESVGNIPCNFENQELKNPAYSLGLPAQLIDPD